MFAFLEFLRCGLLDLPWWGIVVVTLILTHITIAMVTIYLHRCQTHRALELHPVIAHFFRLWSWVTTGMKTKDWVAIHRKHHATVEQLDDPHSPVQKGIWNVLSEGTELYREEARNKETIEKYGYGTPDDWLEQNVYSQHCKLGIVIMLFCDVALFGVIGITVWAIQMVWIPLFAAGVINGMGHWKWWKFGYRNYELADNSQNITRFGFLIGGEELHNNHHGHGSSAKFSDKWWEFDIGWLYIVILQVFRLAKNIKVHQISPIYSVVLRVFKLTKMVRVHQETH